jgi:hypothetical protein
LEVAHQNKLNLKNCWIFFSVEEDAHITVPEWRLHKVQSPILLKHDETNHYDHFEPLEFHGHWDQGGEATLSNNGFTGMPFFILGKDYSSPPTQNTILLLTQQ